MMSSLINRFIVQIQRATDYSLEPSERVDNLNSTLQDVLHINAVISEVPGYMSTNTDKLQVLIKYVRSTIGRATPLCIGFVHPGLQGLSDYASFLILDAGDACRSFKGVSIYESIDKVPVITHKPIDDAITELTRDLVVIEMNGQPVEIELINMMSII